MLNVLAGGILVAVGCVLQPLLVTLSPIQFSQGALAEGSADFSLLIAITGLMIIFVMATRVLRSPTLAQKSLGLSLGEVVFQIFRRRRYSLLFSFAVLIYGGLFAIASGTIVIQPATNFSEIYHVSIPSLIVVPCCGTIGQSPVAIAYVTEHIGVLIVPANLVLLLATSWLVGLNLAVAAFAVAIRTRNVGLGWLGGAGAFIGLFTACPTCAGLALFTLVAGTSVLSTAFFLGPLQSIFLLLSIPFLIVSPFFALRRLARGVCEVR